jgi:hypothetical protein
MNKLIYRIFICLFVIFGLWAASAFVITAYKNLTGEVQISLLGLLFQIPLFIVAFFPTPVALFSLLGALTGRALEKTVGRGGKYWVLRVLASISLFGTLAALTYMAIRFYSEPTFWWAMDISF